MKVPFLHLKPGYDELRAEVDAAYHRVMDSGWCLLGRELEQFETEFATYCQSNFCVGLANGLEAQHLILKAYDVGAGDEVIVPINTFITTWLAVSSSRDHDFTRRRVRLNRGYYGLYVPNLIWRELENFSSGAICVVLTSQLCQ